MSQNINLYDPALRARRDLLGAGPALGFTLATVLAVTVAAGAARWSLAGLAPRAAESSAALAEQNAALQALLLRAGTPAADTALQARIASAQRTLLQRRAALQSLGAPGADRDAGFSARLAALARQSLDGLWLTGMTLQQDNVLLKGRTLTPSLIPTYVQRLDQEASLQGHAFRALDVKRPLDSAAQGRAPSDPPVGAAAGESPAAPVRAAFVDFTLVGTGSVDTASGDKDKEPRP